MDVVDRTVRAVIAEGRVPSASVVVRTEDAERYHETLGVARLDPRRPAHPDQAYDLASVTKVLAGSTVAACLVAEGRLDLNAPVSRWLGASVHPGIEVRHLLQHTSGLPAWAPLYQQVTGCWGTEQARRTVLDAARVELRTEPGAQACYSDLGFLLLLDVLERAGGAPLDLQLRHRVLRPLGIDDLRFGWPGAAATEDCPVRGFVVEGTVHDLNCAALGGVSTHAGLFGTARAVAALGQALLDALSGVDGPLPSGVLQAFAAARGPGSHRIGFDGISPGASSTGRHFPPDTVGHLGYTGTSLWLVPSRRAVVVVLTNRVHPVDDKESIRAVRPRIHDAVAEDLRWDRTRR